MRKSSAMRLVAGVATGVLALLPGVTSPAYAARLSTNDAAGDAPARFDITRVTFVNDTDRVSISASVANLKAQRATFGFNLQPLGVPDAGYYGVTKRRAEGSVTGKLVFLSDVETSRVDCEVRGTWRPSRDRVRISFPQSCLQWHGDVRISAFLGDTRHGDPDDQTKRPRVPFN